MREMRTLTNTCQEHAADAAKSWKNCHTLAATAHSAANRARVDAISAEKAARDARKAKLTIIIALLIAILGNAALHFFIY